ncbi:MAG: OmpA family protein [Gammaproteobacteria bacterium]|nr:OmpA family protein [Gammaproteobacteria bacterium]
MQNKPLIFLLFVLTYLVSVPAQAANSIGYWYDTSGDVARTNSGECVRSIRWSSNNALPECENAMPKKVAEADSDNDGVVDSKDQCKGTTISIVVDANGCELITKEADSDNDGVVDSKDQCKGTTVGVVVDANGCELITKEADADNDGVVDSKDQCEGTALGVAVDADGCGLNKDTDSDGIADANDDCPGTAAGTVVNDRGCVLRANIGLENVVFKINTAQLSPGSLNILDNIAKTLQENQHLQLEVAGHTDNTGDHQYNVNLSTSRAQSVRQYLVDKGVAADRLIARGYGPDKPIASNDTREGRNQNRRVELTLQ